MSWSGSRAQPGDLVRILNPMGKDTGVVGLITGVRENRAGAGSVGWRRLLVLASPDSQEPATIMTIKDSFVEVIDA